LPHHRTKCLILYLNYLLLSVGLDFYFYITSACNIAIIAFRFDVSFIASWNIPSALVWKPGTLTIFGRTYFDFLHFFYCSSDFALRSYLYLFIHALVAGPASLIFGEHKIRVFYSVRIFLGLISTITETVLVVALSRRYGKRLACYVLAMLCLSSGCFFASTSFLPSSFSMYAVTLSSGLFLLEKYAAAVSVAAAGVILGWPFSILVFLPVTVYSLIRGPFGRVFLSGFLTSVSLLVLSFLADYHCYGRLTFSVFNLLKYNVLGGGESHLYGTEGPSFYFRNGFNNFNFAFILALLFLGVVPFARKKYAPDLLIVVSPVYIWLAFMSLQAHKEER